MNNTRVKQAFLSTMLTMGKALPILFGVLLLVSLISTVARAHYSSLFSGSFFFDPLVGAVAGSFSLGIPLTSYIIGGELINEGVSLVAVTAFIMTWSSVGVVMLPLEGSFLSKRFALWRNALNFVMAIAILTVITISII